MRRLYCTILGFYPAEFRLLFAPEMIDVFQEKSANLEQRGLLDRYRFMIRECIALLKGVISEHTAKAIARGSYLATGSESPLQNDEDDELFELKLKLNQLVRSMEFAIAHHDFRRARQCAYDEAILRARLQLRSDEDV